LRGGDPIINGVNIKEGFIEKNSEENCKYISTRGIRKSCDVYNTIPTSDYNTVYIHCDKLSEFLDNIDTIQYKFILVTGDGDLTFPSNIGNRQEKLLDNNMVVHMFIMNCSISHPKITHLPIGINYHTMSEEGMPEWGSKSTPEEQDKELQTIQKSSKPFSSRIIKCFSNFHFNKQSDRKYTYDREDAINQIPTELIYYQPSFMSRNESFILQKDYAFVVSPHGNGLDCHRQWEALCLGSIPIVKTSSIDVLYEGLPVLIVKNWSDINKELLDNTIEEFSKKSFNYDRLLLRYWVDKINSYRK